MLRVLIMHSLILNEVLPNEGYYQIVKDSRVGYSPVIEAMSQWLNSYQHKDVICHASFSYKTSLKKHIKSVHG